MLYHFINQEYGLKDLANQRLKLAIIDELNDPFELLGANLKGKAQRRAFQQMKMQMTACSGFLCFSEKWTNPALWAHYAERHKGFCFGFDVAGPHKKVAYHNERLKIPTERFSDLSDITPRDQDRLFYTKAKCWEYEEERRKIVAFESCLFEDGRYFVPFSNELVLREVYVGAASELTEIQVLDATSALNPSVKIIKVRPAFQSFTLTPDRRYPPEWVIPRQSRLPATTYAQVRASVGHIA